MADAEDRELLRLLTDDPEAGVRGLMDRYGGILYRIAFRLLRSPEDAEEATADTLAAAKNSPQLEIFKRLPMHWLPPGGKRAGCWRRKSRCCPG